MERYSLPFDFNNIDSENKFIVDMSQLNFAVDSDQQKKSSFIFLRNADIRAELDFSACSFDDKESFLLLYLTENIEIHAPILSSTWIEILSAKDGGGIFLPSILNSEERKLFCERNKEFIDEIYQFINSLPIYALFVNANGHKLCDLDSIQKTDYNKIKMANFYKLADYPEFNLLLDTSTEPLFYNKIFIRNEYYIATMMGSMPYLNLISAMMSPVSVQEQIGQDIKSYLDNTQPKED